MSKHWTPPTPGKTSTAPLSSGQFPTMGRPTGGVSYVRPQAGHTASRQGLAKSSDPTIKNKANRSNRQLNPSQTYGPTGIVTVKRSYHGPGCPDCATTSSRTMPSAFGPQDQFRGGAATGSKGS